jgi:sulfur carrier protein ThiS
MQAILPQNKNLFKPISFRCYAELNDFFSTALKQKEFTVTLKTPITVAEAIESIGIPLSEVDLVLVNSQAASRNHRLYENDRVSLFPAFETFDISTVKNKQ